MIEISLAFSKAKENQSFCSFVSFFSEARVWGCVEQGRGCGKDDLAAAQGLYSGRDVCLPDFSAEHKAQRRNNRSGFDSCDGWFQLARGTINFNVNAHDGDFGYKVEVGTQTFEVRSHDNLGETSTNPAYTEPNCFSSWRPAPRTSMESEPIRHRL
jgi:hypothetical protein